MNIKILADLGLELVEIESGNTILQEGKHTKKVYVLVAGKVSIKAKGQLIATVDSPGAILGEISAIMGTEHVASVTTAEDSSFYLITDFMRFLYKNPEACVSVAQVLACRLVNMNNHLVFIKDQIELLRQGLDNYLPVFPEDFSKAQPPPPQKGPAKTTRRRTASRKKTGTAKKS